MGHGDYGGPSEVCNGAHLATPVRRGLLRHSMSRGGALIFPYANFMDDLSW
jgi:hypothetical protein